MTDESPDRTLPPETVRAMVRQIRPEWSVRDATLAESGHTAVYHLTVETPTGFREAVLKATPDGDRHGIDTEARLLAVVADHTAIPVPEVLGVVDARDDLRTPFFLAESMEGTAVPPEDAGTLPDGTLRRIARQTGQYLGELHAIDAVDGFGLVDWDRSEPLRGGRPSADLSALTVADTEVSGDSWPAVLRAWTDRTLDRAAETRFADLTPALREALHGRIDALAESSGTFSPVLARIDHGLHNLLLDAESETGHARAEASHITAVLDWAFTLATPPSYDLACVEYVLAGGDLLLLPDEPDRLESVRTAMLAGYRSSPSSVPEEYAEHRDCYQLLSYARSTHHLETGQSVVPSDRADAAADGLRRAIRGFIDDGG